MIDNLNHKLNILLNSNEIVNENPEFEIRCMLDTRNPNSYSNCSAILAQDRAKFLDKKFRYISISKSINIICDNLRQIITYNGSKKTIKYQEKKYISKPFKIKTIFGGIKISYCSEIDINKELFNNKIKNPNQQL